MGVLARDRFIELAMAQSVNGRNIREQIRGMAPLFGNALNVDRESALQAYEEVKRYICRHGALPGKYLRPWEWDERVYTDLDRTKAWWGFEFETGYRSNEARSSVLEHVWDSWDNVVFDAEGEGAAGSEVTFSPVEMDKFLDGTAPAYLFMDYLTDNPAVDMWADDSAVGTHINMSCAALTLQNVPAIVHGLNRSIAALPGAKPGDPTVNTRYYMFGRAHLYGGFYPMSNINYSLPPGIPAAHWLEGKLFRTTYNIEQFKHYIKACVALTKCMELFATLGTREDGLSGRVQYPHVNNLYEMAYEDAEPEVVWEEYTTALYGTVSNGLINGPLRRDSTVPLPVAPNGRQDDDDHDYEMTYEDEYCTDSDCDVCDGPAQRGEEY